MSVRKLLSTKFNTEMQKRPSGSNNCFYISRYILHLLSGARNQNNFLNSFFIVGHLFYKNLVRLAAFPWEPVDKASLVLRRFLPCSNFMLAYLLFPFKFSWWFHHTFSVKGPLSWHTWLLDWNSVVREHFHLPLSTAQFLKRVLSAFPLILSCSAFPTTNMRIQAIVQSVLHFPLSYSDLQRNPSDCYEGELPSC